MPSYLPKQKNGADVSVVCSTAGTLLEVAGEAGVFFNPYSIANVADEMAGVARVRRGASIWKFAGKIPRWIEIGWDK